MIFRHISDIRSYDLGFASIHNIGVTVINILFDLAAHPQYIPELRTEIERELATEPGHIIRKHNLPKLRKLDSLLRESQRMSPGEDIHLSKDTLTCYLRSQLEQPP
jgi:hypothetical protein